MRTSKWHRQKLVLACKPTSREERMDIY
jgi:hypothetical protein